MSQIHSLGPGISREAQEQIFEKFRQLDGSVTREYGGTGLGLAISRDLAAMLGGRLNLQSEEGVGTEFTIDLPINGPEEAEYARLPLIEDQ